MEHNILGNITPHINENNIENVRKMIARKQSSTPFYGTWQGAASVTTDMDHHPYSRFYRGDYRSHLPIIMEREAGWRIVNNECYSGAPKGVPLPPPEHCFQNACSVVLPCHCDITSQYDRR